MITTAGPAAWIAALLLTNSPLCRDREPRRLGDLLRPELKGKIGLARPLFGTSRTHMATLLALFGEPAFESFLKQLKEIGRAHV